MVFVSPVNQSSVSFERSGEKCGPAAYRAKELLLDYLRKTNPDLQEAEIEWTGQNPHTYSDSSLVLKSEGECYLPRLVEGTEIHFRVNSQDYTIDTAGSRFVLRGAALLNHSQG